MEKRASTNMEKYYGFRFKIEKSLTPENERAVKLKLREEFQIEGISTEDYQIYFHNLIIISKDEHFGFSGGISQRAEEIGIHYSVNQKQVREKSIIFKNYYFDEERDLVTHRANTEYINFSISTKYFDNKGQFGSFIVTLIKKDLRRSHRKIKISITARPTLRFKMAVIHAGNLVRSTDADIKYDSAIQLELPYKENQMTKDSGPTGNTFIFHGSVNNVSSTNSGPILINNKADFNQLVNDLKFLADHAKSHHSTDENYKISIEDAVIVSNHGDTPRFRKSIKAISRKLLAHAESLGAKTLEYYIKNQLDI